MFALEIKNLSKIYPNGNKALKNISFKVKKGDFFGLLGVNGAGKSTTIGIITSLINKTSGSVKIFGFDTTLNSIEAKLSIGLVPQEFNFNIFEKIIHILVTQAGFYGVKRKLAYKKSEYLLEKLGLWEKRNYSPRQLSGGMKRRLMIARSLVHNPKLLILDEPTAGVDIEIRRLIWKFLYKLNKKEGKTIILTTHYLEEIEKLCKNLVIIDNGNVIENNSVKDIIKNLSYKTFILDINKKTNKSIQIKGFKYKFHDSKTIEVTLKNNQNLNDFFLILSKNKILINNMKPKENHLEEFFLKKKRMQNGN